MFPNPEHAISASCPPKLRCETLTCLIKPPTKPVVVMQDQHGLPLGVMWGMHYQEYVLQLNSGHSVFVYTDGVPAANDPSGARAKRPRRD